MSTIVNNTFFKGEIFLPQAKPTITSDVSEIDNQLIQFIKDKEEECLSLSLGELYFDFKSNLNLDNTNGLEDTADQKWDWLLNGRKGYINSLGKKRTFKGIRYKSSDDQNAEYDKSLIAFYVYYYFKKDQYVTSSSVGDTIPKAKNSESVAPNFKMTIAWRNFYKLVVGNKPQHVFYESKHGFGVDYYKPSNIFVSLYDFIEDMNKIEGDIYSDFNPYRWTNSNQLGI